MGNVLRAVLYGASALWLLALPIQALCAATTVWQLQAPPAELRSSQEAATAAARHQQILQKGQLLTPDLSALDQLKVHDSIVLPLPNGEANAVIQSIKHHSAHSYSVIATIQQGNEQLPVVITRGPKGFYGRLVTANQTYAIRGDVKQSRLLPEQQLNDQLDFTQSDALELPTNLVPQQLLLPPDGHAVPAQAQNQPESHPHSTEAAAATDSTELYPPLTDTTTAVVDVLLVYSPAAAALYQGDIQTRVNHLIAVSNQIYQDSGVHLELRAAAMREAPFKAIDTKEQLNEASYRLGAFTDLDKWRFEAGADLVVLLTPETRSGLCGLGWLSTSRDADGQFLYTSSYMISLTHITCGDYVLAHETGHNMGLVHSEKQGDVGNTFPFARGYGVDNNFATVMAYQHLFNAGKVYKFSNPALLCNNLPCGIERHDPHGADAAYAINAIRFGLQNLFQPQQNPLTFEQAIAQIDDVALQGCLQSIKKKRADLHYAGQLTSLTTTNTGEFCSNNNPITSLAGLSLFSNITDINLSYHRITDFSELGQLTRLKSLTLSGSGQIDLQWLTNLTELSSLSLYNVSFTDATPIAALQKLKTLDLTNNAATNFSAIQQLRHLRELTIRPSLSSADLLANAQWLSNLTQLTRLTLTPSQLSNTGMLSAMTQLQGLTLGSTQPLNIDGLRPLTKLFSLDLSSSQQLDCTSAYQAWRALPQLSRFTLPNHCQTDDQTAPVFGPLPDIVLEATAKTTSYTLIAPIARDDRDGDIVAQTTRLMTEDFAVGEHTIYWTATDFNGNRRMVKQELIIRDTTKPILTGPDEVMVISHYVEGLYRYSPDYAPFYQQFSAWDQIDGELRVNSPDQEFWPFGLHQLPLKATDRSGNSVIRSVLVAVNYYYGPTFTAPTSATLSSPGPTGLPATDSQVQQIIELVKANEFFSKKPLKVTADYPAQLRPGKNMVVFNATDEKGFKNSYLLPVFLTDQQAPNLFVPTPLKLTASSSGIAKTDPRIVQFIQSVRATDNFDAVDASQVVINYQLPDRFLPGVTAVLFTATDASGNTISVNGYVEVTLSKRQNRLLKLLLMAPGQ